MNNDINILQFHNDNTLNIFSDASIIGKTGNFTGCYGVVAVVGDNIIDRTYRIVSYTTSNNSEIKGIRAAFDIAMRYKDIYKNINIFSDSLISVNGIRNYINKWIIGADGMLYTGSKKKVANQEIFIESYRILKELELSSSIIRIYHQPGHVNNDYNSLVRASKSFKKINSIKGKIDLNFMRYICTWNNYVDNTSRSMLKRNKSNNMEFIDPLIFTTEFGWL
jgi:ribonuclease HI